MQLRRVHRSEQFTEQAHQLFPPGGSAEGRPSFELFEHGPLRGAEVAFSRAFELQREPVEGVGSLRYVVIQPTSFFGPIVIYACLLRDQSVELVSVIEDEDYWEVIGHDPS